MEDRATKFRKFIEDLPRLCSPTICGTLSQPTTKAERSSRSPKFEWSLEQKAILSPANITTATCSDFGEMDHSFLHHESEQFFSQKTIAPSPVTTPSTRNYSRSQPASYKFRDQLFDERDEDTDHSNNDNDDDTETDDDEDEEGSNIESDSDTDIDMEVLHDDDDDETSNTETNSDTDHDDDMTDEYDHDDDNEVRDKQQDMEMLFLSPPLRSSQTQQRLDIFSPETFGRVMEDESTLQSTPKTIGSQISRTRTRRGSEMSD